MPGSDRTSARSKPRQSIRILGQIDTNSPIQKTVGLAPILSVDERALDQSAAHARHHRPSDAVAFELDLTFGAAGQCVGGIVAHMPHDRLTGITRRDRVAAWDRRSGPAQVASIRIRSSLGGSGCLSSLISPGPDINSSGAWRGRTMVGAAVTVTVDEAGRQEQPLETRVAEYWLT